MSGSVRLGYSYAQSGQALISASFQNVFVVVFSKQAYSMVAIKNTLFLLTVYGMKTTVFLIGTLAYVICIDRHSHLCSRHTTFLFSSRVSFYGAPCFGQRYTYRVLHTIQMKLILVCVWAEPAVLGSTKTALKFKYEIQIGIFSTHNQLCVPQYKLNV